jgi:hypothetical protein
VASSYFTVRWHHDSPDESVLLFEELNEQRLETRKVEEFADGRRIWSDRIAPVLGTSLSWKPIPSEAEIDGQGSLPSSNSPQTTLKPSGTARGTASN